MPAEVFTRGGEALRLWRRHHRDDAKAKAERRPDQPNFSQPIVGSAPFNANLEYRVAGLNANATVHEKEAEMFGFWVLRSWVLGAGSGC